MKIIKASELGSYKFCERAWKFQQQGIESTNQKEMAAGVDVHYQHNRKILISAVYRGAGLLLLSAVIIGLILIGAVAPANPPL